MKTDDALPEKGRRESAVALLNAPTPLAQAARSLEKISRPFMDGLQTDDLMAELARSLDSTEDLELVLFTQLRALDALFKRIMFHDMHKTFLSGEDRFVLYNEKVDLALRSQNQSRHTLEALTNLRRNHKKDPQ